MKWWRVTDRRERSVGSVRACRPRRVSTTASSVIISAFPNWISASPPDEDAFSLENEIEICPPSVSSLFQPASISFLVVLFFHCSVSVTLKSDWKGARPFLERGIYAFIFRIGGGGGRQSGSLARCQLAKRTRVRAKSHYITLHCLGNFDVVRSSIVLIILTFVVPKSPLVLLILFTFAQTENCTINCRLTIISSNRWRLKSGLLNFINKRDLDTLQNSRHLFRLNNLSGIFDCSRRAQGFIIKNIEIEPCSFIVLASLKESSFFPSSRFFLFYKNIFRCLLNI